MDDNPCDVMVVMVLGQLVWFVRREFWLGSDFPCGVRQVRQPSMCSSKLHRMLSDVSSLTHAICSICSRRRSRLPVLFPAFNPAHAHLPWVPSTVLHLHKFKLGPQRVGPPLTVQPFSPSHVAGKRQRDRMPFATLYLIKDMSSNQSLVCQGQGICHTTATNWNSTCIRS